MIPAFSIKKSTSPTSCLSFFQSALSPTSALTHFTSPFRLSFAISNVSWLKSAIVTFIECLRHSSATARPMPDAPPLMRACAEGRKIDVMPGGMCNEFVVLEELDTSTRRSCRLHISAVLVGDDDGRRSPAFLFPQRPTDSIRILHVVTYERKSIYVQGVHC